MIRTTLSGLRTFPLPRLLLLAARGFFSFFQAVACTTAKTATALGRLPIVFWEFLCRPVSLPAPNNFFKRRPTEGVPRSQRSGNLLRQLRLAMFLAGEELVPVLRTIANGLSRMGEALIPAPARFPVALFSYLLLVFALEAFIIQAFSPQTPPLHAIQATPQARIEQHADESGRMAANLQGTLPSAFSSSPGAPLLLGSQARFVAQYATEPHLDELPDIALHQPHRLMTVALATPAIELPPYDSVRMVVDRSSVRMPVDARATHPLDRAGFLATATVTSRLKKLFATADTRYQSATMLAELPKTAIAPPLTRLDKLRMKQRTHRKLGTLCALFESGVRGIFAIGFDPKGGTSYGKYQISSRKGAMDNFLAYMDRRAPSWSMRLRSSGPANTGGTAGSMPREWKKIASEHPKLFERLQDDFIHTRYYSPTLNKLRMRAGLDLNDHPEVVKEVLWSTAVQHGPTGGANIFIKASRRAGSHADKSFAASLLEEVFRERAIRLSKFPGRQRSALQNRLRQEKSMALGRLRTTAATKTSAVAQNAGRFM